MALKPQNEDAFFREVDEELRREQIGTFWRTYGRLVAIAVVVGLVAFGGWLYWQHRQKTAADAASEAMVQALTDLEQGKHNAAKAKLETVQKEGIPAYRGVALLAQAASALERGDVKAAAAGYQAVAADPAIPQPFRDLATIRQTAAEFDTLPPAQVVARLKPLAEAGNPWFGSAGEMTAIAYMKMGKPDLAGPIFAAMAKDEGVPPSIRDRAARLALSLGADAAAPAAPVKAPGAAKE